MAGESEQTMAGEREEMERAKPSTVARERGLNKLKYTKFFWHSTTIPSHKIWPMMVLAIQLLGVIWAGMPNVLYIWHLTGPLLMLFQFYKHYYCRITDYYYILWCPCYYFAIDHPYQIPIQP